MVFWWPIHTWRMKFSCLDKHLCFLINEWRSDVSRRTSFIIIMIQDQDFRVPTSGSSETEGEAATLLPKKSFYGKRQRPNLISSLVLLALPHRKVGPRCSLLYIIYLAILHFWPQMAKFGVSKSKESPPPHTHTLARGVNSGAKPCSW